jgi:hypothetical protein
VGRRREHDDGREVTSDASRVCLVPSPHRGEE